ncbi:MAG TPA: hypothetical protein VFT87_04675 [Candidatus Saccharimonadales bacterium]|nr:hypothetical protein [Candidatus Saccharimonadales bacterium]
MKLPVDMYSPDSLSATIFELTSFIAVLRNAQTRSKNGRFVAPEPSSALNHVLDLLNADSTNMSALEKLNKDLEKHLLSAPVAHITLASLPGSAIKRELTAWFRTNISPEVLLTFTARTDIGGGIVVQAGSHIYDFSFKRLLLANKARIAEIAHV